MIALITGRGASTVTINERPCVVIHMMKLRESAHARPFTKRVDTMFCGQCRSCVTHKIKYTNTTLETYMYGRKTLLTLCCGNHDFANRRVHGGGGLSLPKFQYWATWPRRLCDPNIIWGVTILSYFPFHLRAI